MILYFYDPSQRAWTQSTVKGESEADAALQWLVQMNQSGETYVVTGYQSNVMHTILMLDGTAKTMIVLSKQRIFRQRLDDLLRDYAA